MDRRLFPALALIAAALAPASARAQAATGNTNLHLGVPAGLMLDQTSVQIDNPSIGYSGLVNVGGGLGPFMVTHLPAASGYAASVSSTVVGGGSCTGTTTSPFPIFANSTTIVFVTMTCQLPPPLPAPALGRHVGWLALALALTGASVNGRQRKTAGDRSR